MWLWIIILWATMVITGIAIVYLSFQVSHLPFIQKIPCNPKFLFSISGLIVLILFGVTGIIFKIVNAFVIAFYFAMICFLTNLLWGGIEKVFQRSFPYKNFIAIVVCLNILGIGWFLAHHVWQTDYFITTPKKISDLKIAMFADSHLGTTFNAEKFQKYLEAIQKQNPDLVVVVGDFVDDDTPKEDMVQACESLGKIKTKYGVYFALGNHDKGYYGLKRGFSIQDLISELEKNGVTVLRDEVVLIDDSFYLIGRKDLSERVENKGKRQSMEELTKDLDKQKYIIVLDHQPADYQNQAKSEVDLVLSGHTHGGQLFPFNRVGKWIGVNNQTYGHEKRNQTDFIVTSGISSWAIKFKTGTKSEYVVVNVKESASPK